MRIVVTGGAGMLGSHLATRMAAKGHSVESIDVRDWDAPSGVRARKGDIRDRRWMTRAVTGADVVVHSASALPSYKDQVINSVIVDGTESVLQAADQADVSRVVYISSTSVYGVPKIVPTPETFPPERADTYGRAKTQAEKLCHAYRAKGKCIPILRPKTFLGPGRMGLFAMLFEWADQGRNFPVLGSGNVRIQMLGVDDLVDAVLLTLHAAENVANDTYNIAAAEFGTLREDFQAVLDEAGHGKRVISIPAKPAVGILRTLAGLRLSPVYERLLHKLMSDSYVSITKAADQLGFHPRQSNRDVLLETYRWWLKDGMKQQKGFGNTSNQPWKQGALSIARILF